jgi:hypothetical protein
MVVAGHGADTTFAAESPEFDELWRFWNNYVPGVKTTAYFDAVRTRPDRAMISDAWIRRATVSPIREVIQSDGRIRRWVRIPEMENRYLRVILLGDGETVHNAFLDRGFKP